MPRIAVLFSICVVPCLASIVEASPDANSVERRIAELERQLAATRAEVARLRSDDALARSDTKGPPPSNAAAHENVDSQTEAQQRIPDWVNDIKVKGDFRYRYEWSDDETKAADRHRHRLRARVGVYGQVYDGIDVGLRLASGNNASPTSTNVDLDRGFSSKDIWLDLAYFSYRPGAVEDLAVTGGKIKNPYRRVGNSDLMFDTDVNPEGLAVDCTRNVTSNLKMFAVAGAYCLEERATKADASLWAAQAGATLALPVLDKGHVTVGGGYFDYGSTKGRRALGIIPGEFYGNNATGSCYDSDFDILQVFGQVAFAFHALPFAVFADYVENTAAASDEDRAYLLGFSAGACKQPGSWQFVYNYREVDADAILGVLAEATFAGGGSNVAGHKLSLAYQLVENCRLQLTYMIGERTRSQTTTDYDVALLDLNLRF